MIPVPSGVRVFLATGHTDMRGMTGSGCRSTPRGKFIWPSASAGAVSISMAQMAYMLEGIDWRNPQLTWRSQSAG
jgi:transposase